MKSEPNRRRSVVSLLLVAVCAVILGAWSASVKAAESITILNPSFQGVSGLDANGYGTLTDWTSTDTARSGSALFNNPFGAGVTPADVDRFAFIQNYTDGSTATLSQNISGLDTTKQYWFQVFYDKRQGYADPGLNVTYNGQTLVNQTVSTGPTPAFINVAFTPNAASGTLAITNNNPAGDSALLFDAVSIIQRNANEIVIANPSFEGSTANGVGYSPYIAGWTSSNTARTGVNPSFTNQSPFADNGTIPDGTQVGLIQSSGTAGVPVSLSTTLDGLTVGQTYRLNVALNARSSGGPRATITVGGQNLLNNQVISAVGGTNPYHQTAFYFTATSTTETLSFQNITGAPDTTVLLDNVHVASTTPAWHVGAWSNDATSGVVSSGLYSHAYNLGLGAGNTTINGVLFRNGGSTNPTNGAGDLGGDFTTSGYTAAFANDSNNITAAGGGSGAMASNFSYEGNPATPGVFTLSGLLPGSKNRLTFYTVGFDPTDSRAATFTDTTTGEQITANVDAHGNNNGTRVSLIYTADASGNAVINIAPLGGNSFHIYGFSNRVLTTAPIQGLFNTGVDNNGAALADNALDSHWRLVSDPSGSVDIAPVVATSTGGFPIGPWLGDSSTSAWITPADNTQGPDGDYTYQTTFTLDNTIANIAGHFAVDNSLVEILLNGTQVFSGVGGSFTAYTNFVIDSGFVVGLNTLQFVVHNDAPPGPTGLRVEFTKALQASAVPAPAALPAGLGLLTLLATRLRGRRRA